MDSRTKTELEPDRFIENHGDARQPPAPERVMQQWGTILRPPFQFSRTSQQTNDPDFGTVSADVDGTLKSFINILQADPSANVHMFNWAHVSQNIRVPYDSEYVAVGGRFRRTGGVDLHIVDRNGPSTLDLGLYQRLFVAAFYWDGSAWINLGIRETPLFTEERHYEVGQGGDDDRSWSFDDTVDTDNAFFEHTLPRGTWIQARIGTFAGNTYVDRYFSVSTRNEMNANVVYLSVSGND